MSDLKRQGLRAFAWDFAGKISTHGVTFVISIFLARLLDPSEFGLIAMIMLFVGVANVFVDVGLGGALIQREDVHSVHYSSVFYVNIIAGLLLTLLMFFSASWIGNFYEQKNLIPIAEVLSLTFLVNALGSTHSARLRKTLNYSALARANFLSALMSGLIGVAMAVAGYGIWSLVGQSLAFAFIYNSLVWMADRWRPGIEFSLKALIELWAVGFRLFLAALLDAVVSRIDYLLIGKMFAPETLGFFQRAKSLNYMVSQYASGSLMAVLFPVLSKIQSDIARLRSITLNLLAIISAVTFLLIGIVFLTSEELVLLLFGPKWLETSVYLKMLVLSSFAFPIGALLINVLRSLGYAKDYLRLEIYKKLLVVVNLFLLWMFGIEVFLFGLILKSALGLGLNVLFVSRLVGLSKRELSESILVQAIIATISVMATLLVAAEFELEYGFLGLLLLKSSFFLALFTAMNVLFRTKSFRLILIQLRSVRQ